MNKFNKLFDYILIIFATLTIIYFFILVTQSQFITAYILYPIAAIILFMYSFYELKNQQSIFKKLPKRIASIIKAIIILSLSIFIIVEGIIITHANNSTKKASDYVIVLGARLNGTTPSKSLLYRLDAAIEYHQQFPDVKIIVSGGQGNHEDITEAKAMKEYLVQAGIEDDLIIEEDKSTNTNENIIYSKQIIDSLTDQDYDVTIITNGFHCFRSSYIANKHDLKNRTYSAKENIATAPHYYIREFFGLIKDFIFS